jgi:transposase InsO family protein
LPPEKGEEMLEPYELETLTYVFRRGRGSNPFFLVDYTNKNFRAKLDAAGMTQSMSRVGRCLDNGPMEGFWGILKSEMYYLHKFEDYEKLKSSIENYIDYYNTRRYQKRLNCMAPMEYQEYLSSIAA